MTVRERVSKFIDEKYFRRRDERLKKQIETENKSASISLLFKKEELEGMIDQYNLSFASSKIDPTRFSPEENLPSL